MPISSDNNFIVVQSPGPQGPSGDAASAVGLFDVTQYGAIGDGVVNDRAAIQAAIDDATPGGTVYFPAGTYKVSTALQLKTGVILAGDHRDTTAISGTLDTLTWSTFCENVEIRGLNIASAGGHVLVGTETFARSRIHDCQLTAYTAGKSIIQMSNEDWIGITVEDSSLTRPAGNTVPAVNLKSNNAGTNCNIFRNLWCFGSGATAAPFFLLESTVASNWVYDNTFEDLVMEDCVGGGLEALSVNGLLVQNVDFYDASVSYAADLIKVGQSATGSSLDSRNIIVSTCARRGGTLTGGKYDVNIVPGEVVLASVTGCGHNAAPTLNIASGTYQAQNGTHAIVIGNLTVDSDGIHTWSSDTNLYRSAANTLKTDDAFIGATSIAAGTTLSTQGVTLWPDPGDSDSLVTGQFTPRRRDWNSHTLDMSVAGSGDMFLTFFTADKTESITTVTTYTGAVAAVSPTLCRVGIYSVAANGDLTLINSSTNDTALWIATFTTYAKALSATFSKVAGVRYAVAAVCLAPTTRPQMQGVQLAPNGVMNGLAKVLPQTSGLLQAQTDLPSSVTYSGSLTGYQRVLGFKLS